MYGVAHLETNIVFKLPSHTTPALPKLGRKTCDGTYVLDTTMPIVTDLPCEVIAGVLRGLDDVRFLLPTILACRHLYASYKEYPSVAFDILCRQIGPALLPYSIATFEASRLPKPHTPSSVQQLLDALYNDPGSLVCRLRGRPLSVLGEVAQTHETIEKHASASALDSWLLAAAYSERLRPRCITLPANSALSTAELLRFRRAFYRVKLFVRLFHRDQDRENTALEVQKIEFMSRYSPWAIEQFGCVYYYIEQKIFEGSLNYPIDIYHLPVDLCTGLDFSSNILMQELWMWCVVMMILDSP